MTQPLVNHAPEFIKGTFVWRVVIPDGTNNIARAAECITGVQNLLDRTVRSNVITNGFIGLDDVVPNWDGTWPYILRATYRAGHSWDNIAKFMLAMRDGHNAWISFHTNVTDVNVGLRDHPEMQAFFDRLQAADAIYTRHGYGCGVPFKGNAYIPRTIPIDRATMNYVQPGHAADIFAIVNYKKFWDSGLAKEMFDTFFSRLPYAPLLLYVDVLTSTGSNLTAGLPDGLLGGSEQTQAEGRKAIIEYIESKGTIVGGESPSWWTKYNWNHGGVSFNDYSRIETGYAQGCRSYRGAEWQHVYGNQGAYSLDVDGQWIAKDTQYEVAAGGGVLMTGSSEGAKAGFRETAEWRTLDQVVEGFYLTAIQELYHVGKGNVRLPGGANVSRLDEHRGRILADHVDLYDASGVCLAGMPATEGDLVKPCAAQPQPNSTTGSVVGGLDESLSGACTVTLQVADSAAGAGHAVVRYASEFGGTAEVEFNGESLGEIEFPAIGRANLLGDLAIPVVLRPGKNTLTLRKGSIHTAWSDGTEARWDRQGFRAWNGDVVFGVGYDRMWPDSWSGEKKIYFYSRDGSERTWTLPPDWRNVSSVRLVSLTTKGRGAEQVIPVRDGQVSVKLRPKVPCVLLPL